MLTSARHRVTAPLSVVDKFAARTVFDGRTNAQKGPLRENPMETTRKLWCYAAGLAAALVLAGCVYAPPYDYGYGYGYGPPGYYYPAPAYYYYPTPAFGSVGFFFGSGGHHHFH